MSIDIEKAYQHWLDNANDSLQEELNNMSENGKLECFSSSLTFGTGGLRGFLRAGTNGMNIYTVGQATQGLANYLKSNFKNPSVAIARDSRNMGWEFVKVCVCVLAANGVTVYYSEDVESTPGLSFSVRKLHCSAGICVTASHNPAVYNGYKVYGPDGCQITTKAANAISDEIAKTDVFEDVKFLNFRDAKETEFAKLIGPEVREAFIDAACECSVVDDEEAAKAEAAKLNLTYTALHGTGYPEVMEVLSRNGFTNVTSVKEQAEPDGNFPTTSYPNPETDEALSLGLEYMKKNNSDLLIATDPDADRVGVMVKHGDEFIRLNGNEVGILLFNYICEARAKRGDALSNLVMCTTIVSSDIVDEIAAHYGVEVRRVLTGFKYIGEQILHLEEDDEKYRFMFGFEESCGYLAGTHVRDKDSISSTLLIAQMAAMYKAQGKDLVDILEDIYKQLGYYKNGQVSVEYPGVEGQEKMREVLSNLRSNPIKEYCGLKVVSSNDYKEGIKMLVLNGDENSPDEKLPKSDVLEYVLDGGQKIIVRPSGTEPKIKVYCFSNADTESKSQKLLDKFKESANELLS
ncbi:MAG: phospho-sugar mutase [Coriobacteriia bacterium]|nr:phospho-sugar mutase [Coriobacteriia bacterium]